jgi:hypothetical protein
MPDWEDLIRAHLRGLRVDANRKEEIAVELAAHLEEVFSELRRLGIPETEAIQRALEEIPNWKRLCRQLNRASQEENAMNQRVKSLWIPGLFTLALTMAGLIGAIRAHMYLEYSPIFLITVKVHLLIYLPWLASLPLIGALGTYWSGRMGGNTATRWQVCLIPMAVLTGIFLLPLPTSSFWIFKSILSLSAKFRFIAECALSWVVVPSLALLAGALPFLKGSAESRSAA